MSRSVSKSEEKRRRRSLWSYQSMSAPTKRIFQTELFYPKRRPGVPVVTSELLGQWIDTIAVERYKMLRLEAYGQSTYYRKLLENIKDLLSDMQGHYQAKERAKREQAYRNAMDEIGVETHRDSWDNLP